MHKKYGHLCMILVMQIALPSYKGKLSGQMSGIRLCNMQRKEGVGVGGKIKRHLEFSNF